MEFKDNSSVDILKEICAYFLTHSVNKEKCILICYVMDGNVGIQIKKNLLLDIDIMILTSTGYVNLLLIYTIKILCKECIE